MFKCQELINKHCKTNANGLTTHVTPLTFVDPSIKPPYLECMSPSTSNLIKFPVSNGEINIITNIVFEYPSCATIDSDTESHLECDNATYPSYSSSKC